MAQHTPGAGPLTVKVPQNSPHRAVLETACADLYERFGIAQISAQLPVCLCRYCLSPETHAALIGCWNTEISLELLRAYSGSSHGPSEATRDLWLLLPRYLEFLSQGACPDPAGSDEVLWRFGAALLRKPLPQSQARALEQWGGAFLKHAAWREVYAPGDDVGALNAAKILLSLGWSGPAICSAFEQLLPQAEIGPILAVCLARGLFGAAIRPAAEESTRPAPQLRFAERRGLRAGAEDRVLAWAKGPALQAALGAALEARPDLEDAAALRRLCRSLAQAGPA